MNAAKLLRQKILDLATRGKLTKREKGDEPAAELLARIAAEKQKRLDATCRKHIPTEPRHIDEDEMPFKLPTGWAWCRVEDVAVVVTKGTTPAGGKNSYLSTGINYVRAESIGSDGRVLKDTLKFISRKVHETELKRSVLECDDLLITIAGTLGRVGIVHLSDLPANTNQAVCFVRFADTKLIDVRYARIALISPVIQELLLGKKKVTGVPNLTLEIISNCIIPLPPLAEQKRIVSRVDELFAEVDKYSAAMDALASSSEMMEKKVLDHAIRGKLTKREKGDEPAAKLLTRIAAEKQKLIAAKKIKKEKPLPPITADEKPFDLPNGWEWCRLGDVGEIVLGKMLNRSMQVGKVSEYLCTINVDWGGFDLSRKKTMCFSADELKYYDLRKGDLLVCEGGDVGRCAVWQGDESYPFQNSLHRIRMIAIVPEYVQMYIQWLGAIGELQRMCSGVTIKHFTNTIVSRLPVPIPPLSEQKRIVARVDELLAECRKMRGE